MSDNVLIVVLTCSGFWAVINSITAFFLARRQQQDDAKIITKTEFDAVVKGVRGLLYGELERRCTEYLQEGAITAAELNDLRKYYYEPYSALDGDGTIESLFRRVEELKLTK